MKRTNIYRTILPLLSLIFVATTSLLASCSNDDEVAEEQSIGFKFTAGAAEPTSLSLTITPDATDKDYIVHLLPTAQVEGKSDVEIADTLLQLEAKAPSVKQGEQTVKFDGLTPSTDYTIFAVGYDGSTKTTKGRISSQAGLKTADKPLAFNIEISGQANEAITYTVTPTDPAVSTWFSDILSKEKFDTEVANPENGGSIKGFDKAWFTWMAGVMGSPSWTDELAYYLKTGTQEITTKPSEKFLRWNTDYVVYCYGVNKDGTYTSDVVKKTFKTAKPVPSTNKISAKIKSIEANSFVAAVTTSNDDPYFITAQRKDNVDTFKSDDDLVYSLVSQNYSSPVFWQQGSIETDPESFSYLDPDTDYYLIIFGYNNGPTTSVQKIAFHTKAE